MTQTQRKTDQIIILVDEQDNPIGEMEKIEAHEKGLLHRAFSVFIFNDRGEVMLHRRAPHKYHCAGLWTNTCCSHPRVGEDVKAAAERRLKEEMGFTVPLTKIGDFVYHAEFDNGLSEHEFDHVFVGHYNDDPVLNRQETDAWEWRKLDEIQEEITLKPKKYTPWFKIIFQQFYRQLNEQI